MVLLPFFFQALIVKKKSVRAPVEEEENPGSTVTQLLKENGGTIMDSLFRGLNRQLLPNSRILFLAAVESTVVFIFSFLAAAQTLLRFYQRLIEKER